jgi:sugar phosphate isomerase/epimerase
MHTRRQFIGGVAGAAAWAAVPGKDEISLAAWSINRSFFVNHRWTNLELPKICRETFGIGALEFVNQFFANPTTSYLHQLKQQAHDNHVRLVRIMVDDEGNMAAADRKERMDSAIAHRKWVDIAHYLGCDDIRCNMRGGLPDWKQDKDLVKRAAESFSNLLEYAQSSGLDIIIENHGGPSSDADVLVGVMKAVNNPRFGVLPDFGNINDGDDRYEVIRRIMPYAKGVSVKAAWSADGSHPRWDLEKLIKICQDAGFHGYWGIESNFGQSAERGQGGRRAPAGKVSPDQLWENEVKGVMLAKAVLDRVIFRKAA